jgi:hypothetical protein
MAIFEHLPARGFVRVSGFDFRGARRLASLNLTRRPANLTRRPAIERALLREFRRRLRGEEYTRVKDDALYCLAPMQHHV